MKRLLRAITWPLCIAAVLYLIFGVPFHINECYKVGGYITMWNAADVLNYYGIILGAIVSVCVMAATVYYNRRQLVSEAKRQTELKKWETIEKSATEVLDAIHPYNLKDLTSKSLGHSDIELYGNIVMYQVNATKAVDKFRHIAKTEKSNLLDDLTERIDCIAKQCIELQQEYLEHFKSGLQDQLGTEFMQKNGHDPQLIQLYNAGIMQNGIKRGEELTEKIEKVYKGDYCPLITQKTEVFSEIYKKIAEN